MRVAAARAPVRQPLALMRPEPPAAVGTELGQQLVVVAVHVGISAQHAPRPADRSLVGMPRVGAEARGISATRRQDQAGEDEGCSCGAVHDRVLLARGEMLVLALAEI